MRLRASFLIQLLLIFCGVCLLLVGVLGFFESIKNIAVWPPSKYQPTIICGYLCFFGLATIILETCGGKSLNFFPFLNSYVGSGFFLLLVGILAAGTQTYGYDSLGVILGSFVAIIGICFFVVACFFTAEPNHEPLLGSAG